MVKRGGSEEENDGLRSSENATSRRHGIRLRNNFISGQQSVEI